MELFLVNYRQNDSVPLKSIMQLPKEEAFKTAEKLYNQSQCRAHKRFGPDFPKYYEARLQTEKWLYDSFILLGGKPQTKHPFYFVLQSCENFNRNFDYGKQIRLNTKDIDPSHISFTLGDSMAQMYAGSLQPLFLMETLYEQINSYDHINKFLEYVKDQYVCIEAQIWTDQYFAKDLIK
jgi:hypothetical protein